jgi:hypothetical protein
MFFKHFYVQLSRQQAAAATVGAASGGWWDRMKQFTASTTGPHENIPQLKQVCTLLDYFKATEDHY